MGLTVHFEVLNQLGTPLMYSATLANRPAAGIAGRIFFRTDSPYGIYRDTGSAWDLIAQSGGGTITGSGAATQVAFWNSATGISGSNNLFWDSTNNNLGINTNTPGNALDVHTGTISTVAALNQTTLANNTLLAFLNTNTPLWRVGNFYTAGANDFSVFDVVGNLQQLTISNTTGQTFIGAKTTASGRLVINSATADAHLQIVGANSPSIRIDNAGSGGTQRFAIGNATATNNFIQGSAAGDFCITTASAGSLLFGMWQTVNATEVMRITTANNLLIGSSVDNGGKLQVTGGGNFTGSVSAVGLFGYILKGRSSDNIGAFGFYDNTGATRYGYIQSASTNGGQLNITMDGGGQIIGDSRGLLLQPASGNVLIGTSTDNGQKLQVIGSVKFSSGINDFESDSSTNYCLKLRNINANSYGLFIQSASTPNSGFPLINITDSTAATSYFRVDSGTGNVGINTSPGTQKLYLNGSFRIDGQTSGSAGGSSGQHLIINCDGTSYKIALLNT